MHASKLTAQKAGGMNPGQSVNATQQRRQPLRATRCGVRMVLNKRHQQNPACHDIQRAFSRFIFSAFDIALVASDFF
jgi:hypothetical protein